MYNSKHPCTWDESLPYVQDSYNQALHNSTNHNPFHVGLGFQPLCPIDIAMSFVATQADSTHVQSEVAKANNFIECIQHIHQQFHDIFDRTNAKYKQRYDHPPFLGMHPMFNVDRLQPYFPPFLDTSDIEEQLTPTKLNPECMEQATTD
jgi:hypothetical protein